MRTLLIESSPGAGQVAADALLQAGHEVERCSVPGRGPFPCREVEHHGDCPLTRSDSVDVVLVARTPDAEEPTAREAGVTCALKAGVPVAVLGDPARNPFRARTVTRSDGDAVSACLEAVRSARRSDAQPARIAVAQLLARHGIPADAVHATVERTGDHARLRISVPGEAADLVDVVTTQAYDALHRHLHQLQVVDVSVEVRS